jgi:hypothetical protein
MYVPGIDYCPTDNINDSRRRGGVGQERELHRQIYAATQDSHASQIFCKLVEEANENEGTVHQAVAKIMGITSKKNNRIKVVINNNKKKKELVTFSDLTQYHVKVRTGFRSPLMMISFICVVNEGDIKRIEKSVSTKLTWLQEWYIYFEIIWGRSSSRWVDMEMVYGLSNKLLRVVFDAKLSIVIEATKMASVC